MWELDHKEDWAPKNWCFLTAVLEKTPASPLDSKEIKPVNPKGNQLWIFIGRTDAKAEAPILWPPDAKSWLTGKDPDAGKNWGQEERGMTEHEMAGLHHWLNGQEFEQTPGNSDGQGSLACWSLWDSRVGNNSATTMWLRIHPPKQETRVQSLGQEDPLKKEMATHSIILAWDIPWTEELGGLQSMGSQT